MHCIVQKMCLGLVAIFFRVQGQRIPFPASRSTTQPQQVSSFGQPFRCYQKNSLYNGSPHYPDQSRYTQRQSIDCCYSDDTRMSCCLGSYYEHSRVSGFRLRYGCRCDPAVTCNGPAPCPTTSTTTPTTTPTPAFCASYIQPLDRVLNGLPVTDNVCLYKGLATITFGTDNEQTLPCQAVYTTSVLNGQNRDVFVTADRCITSVENLVKLIDFNLNFNTESYDLNTQNFDFVTGSDGTGYFAPMFRIPAARSCQFGVACPHNALRGMPPVESLTNCSFVSYGAVNTRNENDGLKEVPVRLSQAGCASQRSLNNISNGLCFASTSGLTLYCTGDLGAPVYCKIPETQETVFVGNAAFQDNCNAETDILVLPFSG